MVANTDTEAVKLAELFKVFGDETRMKILLSLAEGEKYVNDIASPMGVTQSAVSHQLKMLKEAKLVKSKRLGRMIAYSLDDDHVKYIIGMGLDHVRHTEQNDINN